MIKTRCPICDRPMEAEKLSELPNHPFCSPRCRQIDLGRWLDGRYAIPEPENPNGLALEED